MIKLATEEHLSFIVQIEKELFSMPWSENGFREALESENANIWVSLDENVVQGYLVMYTSIDEGEITNVAVAPGYRKAGIGTNLVKTAQDYARDHQINRVVLEVRVSNHSAISVYEKMNFQNLGIRKGFYDLPKEDAMIMAWENDLC